MAYFIKASLGKELFHSYSTLVFCDAFYLFFYGKTAQLEHYE